MSNRQQRKSTADPLTANSLITEFFQPNTAEANNGVVQPLCGVDPGGSEDEFQDSELSSPALDECGDEQAGTLMTPLLSCDMIRTTRSKFLAKPMTLFLANVKM